MFVLLCFHCASREKSCCTAKDPAINEVILENIKVKNNHCGKISTVDFIGPIYVSYISEQQAGLTELPVPKETFSSGVLPYFSFARSITPPDSPPLIQWQQWWLVDLSICREGYLSPTRKVFIRRDKYMASPGRRASRLIPHGCLHFLHWKGKMPGHGSWNWNVPGVIRAAVGSRLWPCLCIYVYILSYSISVCRVVLKDD